MSIGPMAEDHRSWAIMLGLAAIYPSSVVRDRGVKYRLLVEFP